MSGQIVVGVVMGSGSDYAVMRAAVEVLTEFEVPHETRIVSAHRTPDLLFSYASGAVERGLRVIIAGAGGAAHLPGMLAAKTVVPVLGVPISATALQGMDALLSIVQMPKGVPVGTLAIGAAGAMNAGLLAIGMLATTDAELQRRLIAWRETRTADVLRRRWMRRCRDDEHRRAGDWHRGDSAGSDDRHLWWRPAWSDDGHGGAWHGISHPGARS